jgi:hypothetical protein
MSSRQMRHVRSKQTRCANNTMRSLGDIKMLHNPGRKWVTDFLQMMWNHLWSGVLFVESALSEWRRAASSRGQKRVLNLIACKTSLHFRRGDFGQKMRIVTELILARSWHFFLRFRMGFILPDYKCAIQKLSNNLNESLISSFRLKITLAL